MVSNYFLNPENSVYAPKKSQQEIAQMAIIKTEKETNPKRFNHQRRAIDAAAFGILGGGTLLLNGAAGTTLICATQALPFLGILGLDKLLRNKSEKYKKFRSENPTSTSLGVLGAGWAAATLTMNAMSKDARDYKALFKIQSFYDKISDFIKNNTVSNKIKEIYTNKCPQGCKDFFKNTTDKLSNIATKLRETPITKKIVFYLPLALFIFNTIRSDVYRNKQYETLQKNYNELNMLNNNGIL